MISSPLLRARQTAELLAAGHGLPVEVRDEFAELDFGAFEGLTAAEARQRFPDELAAWRGSPEAAPPRGESFAAAARRVRRGRDAVLAAHPEGTVVVVTHVTPIKLLVRAALEAPLGSIYRMYLEPASVSAVEYAADGSAALVLFNDVSHLSEPPDPSPGTAEPAPGTAGLPQPSS